MTKRVLDFIVIGAQKSGTTSLFEYMRRHPQLCLPSAKEVPYFSNDVRYREDWEAYLRKAFPFCDPQRRWGTVTPQYMYGGVFRPAQRTDDAPAESDVRTVPLRIHERLPDVRLISILRDPVARARSHHAMTLLNGWETRPFDQAVRDLLSPEALARSRRVPEETSGYVAWGEYGRILAGYLDVFSLSQMLVLFTSDLRSDPRAVVRRVFDFLSVDPEFVPDTLGIKYREGGASRRAEWLDLNRLQQVVSSNPVARRTWHSLPERARRRVDARFDRINYLSRLWNRRGMAGADRDPEIDRRLCHHYGSDAELLAKLFGISVPWSSIHASSLQRRSGDP